MTLSLRPSKHLFGLVRLGLDRAFRWSGAGAASWCLALFAVGLWCGLSALFCGWAGFPGAMPQAGIVRAVGAFL